MKKEAQAFLGLAISSCLNGRITTEMEKYALTNNP
jgi:hypothetical protein